MNARKSAAQRVRLLRGDLDLSQKVLAARVGVAPSTISGIERGAQGISGIAGKLAQELGTTTDYLYGLTDNPLPAEDDEAAQPISPLRDAILDELERLDDVDQRSLYEIAVTLRLAKERRAPYRVQE